MSKTVNIQAFSGGTVLAVAFFVAKILGYINWSWWLVFLPIWGPALLVLLFIGFVMSVAVLATIFK